MPQRPGQRLCYADNATPIPSHASPRDAINTLILYATGNGDTEVTEENVDLFTFLDTVNTPSRLSMVQLKITDFFKEGEQLYE